MTMSIEWLRPLRAAGAALIAIAAFAGAASAQVTSAQQSAIRANCRSDFMSKCSGVTPGGKDALACLHKNVASLSAGCKTAVSATIPAPAPAAAKPAPAAPTPPPAAAAAAPAAAPAPPPPVAKPKRAERPARPPRPPKKPADAPKQAVAARRHRRQRRRRRRVTRAQCAGRDDRRDRAGLPARSDPALPRYPGRRRPQARLPDRACEFADGGLPGGDEDHHAVALGGGAALVGCAGRRGGLADIGIDTS